MRTWEIFAHCTAQVSSYRQPLMEKKTGIVRCLLWVQSFGLSGFSGGFMAKLRR